MVCYTLNVRETVPKKGSIEKHTKEKEMNQLKKKAEHNMKVEYP